MVKTKLSINGMLKKPWYNSIYELTRNFQNKENGLQHKHYRYALVKNDKNKNQLGYLKTFFLDSNGNNLLEKMYNNHLIQKDCITGDNLKNFLKLMVEKGILEITNPDETVKRYKIPITVINGLFKEIILKRLHNYPNDRIAPTTVISDPSLLNLTEEKVVNGLLFGFPIDFLQNLKQSVPDDFKVLKENMLNIYKNSVEINKVLCKYTEGGIGKISLIIESSIQPQLKEQFKVIDKKMEKLKNNIKNMKNGFRS